MSEATQPTVEALLEQIQLEWDKFNAYLRTLTEKQINEPTDAAGWTLKDHIIHLAIWEDGVNALLEKESRRERMGIPAGLWRPDKWVTEGYDAVNAVIQQRYHDLPLNEVLKKSEDVHERLIENVMALSDNDLQRPLAEFGSDSASQVPIYATITGNTTEHYMEHAGWMAAIVGHDA